MSNIRVFLADDQPIVRRGIALVLLEDPSIDVVGEAGDGCETIESVQLLSPHVVLMGHRYARNLRAGSHQTHQGCPS